MKKITMLIAAGAFILVLANCTGGGEEQGSESEDGAASAEEQTSAEVANNEVVVGGFAIEGPNGEISVPETTLEREAVEDYVQSVRPVTEDTARDLSQFIDPSVELQDGTLTLSVEQESIEEARVAAEDGLESLRQVEPPEGLEPVHETLIATYVQALAAYDNVIQAFDSGDVDALADAVQENLPEIEQLNAEARAILQELERAETVNPDAQAESQG
ncbi:MAG: hypothetical protein M3283_03380 [Actinomycetota bacterium]|nr:hypothetical protein [Actinomycetota bacterium]